MNRACFVSDLHLFTSRSDGDTHREAIEQAAARSHHCILGGDIFDFKWSTLPSLGASIHAACDWLHALCIDVPDCQFHFLLGNHDYVAPFIDCLPDLKDDLPNFSWDRFYHRLGDSVFLHGDVADRRMTAARLEKRRARHLQHHRGRTNLHHRTYDLFVKSQVHRLVPRAVYPPRVTARRILAYLEDIGHGPGDGVQHVYFGHTHRPLSGYRHGGLIFHNGGAPIGRERFRIIELQYEPHE